MSIISQATRRKLQVNRLDDRLAALYVPPVSEKRKRMRGASS
jgi:hypothetical protein